MTTASSVAAMLESRGEVFDAHRPHLRAVGYRMLGSVTEADDAVQDAWFRFSRVDVHLIDNPGGWLTTVVSRICLDRLRQRYARPEQALDMFVPDPIVTDPNRDPEASAVLADSIGFALLLVLDTLPPPERLAFVLHDGFGVPYDAIAPIVERSTDATRQLASRARRRIHHSPAQADTNDPTRKRDVVEAWAKAAQAGDFDALLELLDPDAVLRVDTGNLTTTTRVIGATAIARSASAFGAPRTLRLVNLNGAPGLLNARDGQPVSLAHFTIAGGAIVAVDILADPARLRRLGLESIG